MYFNLPLLDHVESKYPSRDHSFILGNHIFSYLASVNWRNRVYTRQIFFENDWGGTLVLTAYVLSMAVNTLSTGLIVFKILKVFSEVKAILVERTLGITGGTKLRYVIFVIIESGMALFAIQLVRVVFQTGVSLPNENTFDFSLVINQMFNGITPTIILVRVSLKLSFEDEESFKEAVESFRFNNPPSDSDPYTLALQLVPLERSTSRMPSQDSPERNEDICFNNSPGDPSPNTLGRIGRSSSMPPQERSEDILEVFRVETATE